MRSALWHFDFVSPFSWLCLHRMQELPADLRIEYRPVLFAGILNHHGQKGPAEIPAKRRYTYRWVHWWAGQLGVPLRFPTGHPFNPLHHLRLAIAAGCAPEAVRRIFEAVWTTGADATDPGAFAALRNALGVSEEKLGSQEVKDALRRNTEQAIALGVFGVPSFEVEGEIFWGADSVPFLAAWLKDPAVLRSAEMQRLDALPVSAARRS